MEITDHIMACQQDKPTGAIFGLISKAKRRNTMFSSSKEGQKKAKMANDHFRKVMAILDQQGP
jgi:hypothetical protein